VLVFTYPAQAGQSLLKMPPGLVAAFDPRSVNKKNGAGTEKRM
jgi:hypothetical protein